MIDTDWIRKNLRCVDEIDVEALCDEIDRLRAVEPKPQGKTVRVRFPGMIDGNGAVIINNYHRDRNGDEHHSVSSWPLSTIFWITADLPIPEETTVESEVENGNN